MEIPSSSSIPDEPPESYHYKGLPATDCIRIINLHQGRKNDKIRCEITIENRDDAADTYDAISYVWGDPKATKSITCDDTSLNITANLTDALQALRDVVAPRRLWADAICINQGDNVEKAHQIKAMDKIYEGARTVFVWLGPDTDGVAEDCFNLIQETTNYFDNLYINDIPRLQKPYPICSDRSRWDNLQALVSLPWFSRVWVIQEVGLAKRCLLIWGEQQLHFFKLVELTVWVRVRIDLSNIVLIPDLSEIGSAFIAIQAGYTNKETWRMSTPFMRFLTTTVRSEDSLFLETLTVGRSRLASKPRDYIYAFLGHPSAFMSSGELIIEPRYDETVETVFFDLAWALLKNTREASFVLSYVHFYSEEHFERRTWPSWIPRWGYGSGQLDKSPWPSNECRWGYDCSEYSMASPGRWYKAGGAAQLFQFKIDECEHPKSLVISGIVFHHLTWASSPNLTNELKVQKSTECSNEPAIDLLRRDVFEAMPCDPSQLDHREDVFSLTLVLGYPHSADDCTRTDLDQHRLDYAAYLQASRGPRRAKMTDSEDVSSELGNGHVFQERLLFWEHRKMACTHQGRFAIVPACAKVDDVCCVVPGLSTALILRKAGEGVSYLLGDLYVHGIMNGELTDELEVGKRQLENIRLI